MIKLHIIISNISCFLFPYINTLNYEISHIIEHPYTFSHLYRVHIIFTNSSLPLFFVILTHNIYSDIANYFPYSIRNPIQSNKYFLIL